MRKYSPAALTSSIKSRDLFTVKAVERLNLIRSKCLVFTKSTIYVWQNIPRSHAIVQCESTPPRGFLTIFPNWLGILISFLHTYYVIISTPWPEKNGPPKHVKITLWIENFSDYFSFLCPSNSIWPHLSYGLVRSKREYCHNCSLVVVLCSFL